MSEEYKTADGHKYIHGKKYWGVEDTDVFDMLLYAIDTSNLNHRDGVLRDPRNQHIFIETNELYKEKSNAVKYMIQRIETDIEYLNAIKKKLNNGKF